jgi:hypothetical protein
MWVGLSHLTLLSRLPLTCDDWTDVGGGEICLLAEILLTWQRWTHILPSKALPFGWSYTAKSSRVHHIYSPGGTCTMWAANTDKLKHLWKWKINLYEHNRRLWRRVYSGTCQQGRQCTYNVTMRRARANIVAVEKQCVTYCGCLFVALGFQHAVRMHHTVIWCLPPLYSIFPHFFINGTISEKKKLLNTKWWDIYIYIYIYI